MLRDPMKSRFANRCEIPRAGAMAKGDHERRRQVAERSRFIRKQWLGGRRDEPPNQRVEREQIGRQDRIRSDPPEEKSDVHDLPRRDSVGDDEAEDDDPERRELHRDRAFHKWAKPQHSQGDFPCDDKLELDFLDAGAAAQIADAKNNDDHNRAHKKRSKEWEERSVNRDGNQFVAGVSLRDLGIAQETTSSSRPRWRQDLEPRERRSGVRFRFHPLPGKGCPAGAD